MLPQSYGPFPYSAIIDRPPLHWPNGAYVAVWIVPNIEFCHLDQPVPHEPKFFPNVQAWSHRDYGNRVGVFRFMDVLSRRNIRATVALNSDVCLFHPRIIERGVELNWEFMGHGRTNSRALHLYPPEEEADVIGTALSTIASATGTRPSGWLGSGMHETWNTLDILAAEGVRYVGDWINDDQPYIMNVGARELVSIPYSLELNDIRQIKSGGKTAREFEQMIEDQFEVLYREGQASGRVMAIALHPYVMGMPHRIGALERALDFIGQREHVWFATGNEIAAAYLAQTPTSKAP